MARPRSEEAHRAVLDATVELLVEVGVEGTTLEEVAARSGVAKSTVYRHFGTREGLLASAAHRCAGSLVTPDTGSLEGDLRELFAHYTAPAEATVNDLLPLLIDGKTARQIGETLYLSHRTVEHHIANIYAKLGVRTRAEVASAALDAGLLRPRIDAPTE